MPARAYPLAGGRGAILAGMIPFLLFLGCSSAKQTAASSGSKSAREYEKEFDPRKYDPKEQPAAKGGSQKSSPAEREQPAIAPAERVERLAGYRVQIYSTYDLDDAVRTKGMSQAMLDSMRVYMVYDAPVYKIRVGDFLTKSDADAAKQALRGKGFNDAWIVPDQISRPAPTDK